MASPKEGENGEGGGEPPQTNNGIGPEGEDSKCTKFGGGGDTTGETAVSDDTKPAETAEMSVTESDAAIISRKRNRSSGSLSSCDSNTSFKRIKYENTSQVANLKSALSQLNLEFKEFVFTAPPGFVFEPGISVEAEYAGYYMVGNTKISGTGNKPYHCQRSAAQKALEYIENKLLNDENNLESTVLTNGESSKESSNEIQINNEDKTTAEECAAEISSTNCEKSSNEMDEKSANDIDEKSSNDNGEKSVNDNYNVDTDNVNESEVTEDAEVDFHATLVKVWADISKELEVENTEVKNEILESGKSRTMIGKLSAESPAGLGSPAQAKSKSAQLLLKQLQEMYEEDLSALKEMIMHGEAEGQKEGTDAREEIEVETLDVDSGSENSEDEVLEDEELLEDEYSEEDEDIGGYEKLPQLAGSVAAAQSMAAQQQLNMGYYAQGAYGMSSNQAAYLQQLQRNKMMAAEAAAVLNPLAAAFPGLAATSSLDKNGVQMTAGQVSSAERALMLVNLENPEDRSVLDINNMKKGHKLRLMAAILESCADQDSDSESEEFGGTLGLVKRLLPIMKQQDKINLQKILQPSPMMWGGVPGSLAAAYGAAAGHPYGAMSAAAGMWPPHGQPGYGQPMKPQPPPPPKPDPVQKYCQFPLPGSVEGVGPVSVTTDDYKTLKVETYLNDTIIDFYLRYLQFAIMDKNDRDRVHMFTTFWYSRLTAKPTPIEAKKEGPVRRHDRVKRWTRKTNIFEKDFIVVPVNENSHWYLAIICYPGQTGCRKMEDSTECPVPRSQIKRKKLKAKIKNLKGQMKMNADRRDFLDDRDEPWASEDELDHEKENLDLNTWNNKLKTYLGEDSGRGGTAPEDFVDNP